MTSGVKMSFATVIDRIENRTFDELNVGDTASISRTLTQKDIELFAIMSGDVNPAHVDEEFAKSDMFHKIIAHGMWGERLSPRSWERSCRGPERSTSGSRCAFAVPSGWATPSW
jgi:acyl dehydratase